MFGEGGVGKTSIIKQLIRNEFNFENIDWYIGEVDGIPVTLEMCDYSNWTDLRLSILRHFDGFVMKYSITSAQSFRYLNKYLIFELHKIRHQHSRQIPIILVGNKCSLRS